jgi:hypothetical protein
MKLLGSALCGLVAVLASSPAAAATCRGDLHTLLRVHGALNFTTSIPERVEEEWVITKGGAVSATQIRTRLCCDERETQVFSAGQASQASLFRLLEQLALQRVGFQTSCLGDNVLIFTGLPTVRIDGVYEVTWYGRRGRQNRFTVLYADPGTSELPECSSEAQDLIVAIARFVQPILEDPTKQVCTR